MTIRHQLIQWMYRDEKSADLERFVPGDPSLWNVIEDNVGKLNFELSDALILDWGEEGPSVEPKILEHLFTWPGVSFVHDFEDSANLVIQIRAKNKNADPLHSLLNSYFLTQNLRVPQSFQKIKMITIAGAKPEKVDSLLISVQKLVQFGAKSGLYDPLFQEARVASPKDHKPWDYVTSEKPASRFVDFLKTSKRHPLSYKFVVKETGSKYKDGDVVTTVSPFDVLGSSHINKEYTCSLGFDPLTVVLGLQARFSKEYSKVVERDLEILTSMRDRGVSLSYATELYPYASFVEVMDGFRETLIQKFAPPTENAFLYISRPYDRKNSFEARKFERFLSKVDKISTAISHMLALEYGLCMSVAKLVAKEGGMMLFDVVLQQLSDWDHSHSGSEKVIFLWVSDEAKKEIEQLARSHDIGLLCVGQRQPKSNLSIITESDEIQEVNPADLMATVQAHSENAIMGVWTYEDDKRPSYGFERANVYPDRFLMRSTQKNRLEMEVGNLLSSFFAGDLSRVSLQRGSFSYPLGSLRWSDGASTFVDAGGQTHGISRCNPRLMGVTIVDEAVRWMLAQGSLPEGSQASLFLSLPESDVQKLSSQQRAALSLAFDGMMTATKDYKIQVSNVRYTAHSGPNQQMELVFRISKPIDPKNNFTIPGFRMEDEILYAVGPRPPFVDVGSKILPYVRVVSNHVTELSFSIQHSLYQFILQCMEESLLSSLRPVSHGGIAEALGEMALWSGMGAKIKPSVPTIELFSGAPGRFVVGVLPQHAKQFEAIIPGEFLTQLGSSGGKKVLSLPLDELFKSRKELANVKSEVM